MQTLYWHDYETWGIQPAIDRPCQFAGVRTNLDLEVIEDPLIVYCQPPEDILPHPEACLVTGITPQTAQSKGLSERAFAGAIHDVLAQPGTCGVGYNSIRFDDEVTRYMLYRNYYDPYAREWANGNARWDIIDMVRMCYALRPEGIEWPQVEGKPSFRLENLTAANGIGHASAHDAYSDVEATIALARLIKQTHPKLYEYAFGLRDKKQVAGLIDLDEYKPLLHVSSMFPSERACTSLVMPLAMHSKNKNAVIMLDLSESPDDLLSLGEEAIAERVFTAQADLPNGLKRIPLKQVHLNKSPMLATPSLLTPEVSERIGLDKTMCEQHWQRVKASNLPALQRKVKAVFDMSSFDVAQDPERKLYDGFIPNSDKSVMEAVRGASDSALAEQTFLFKDPRLQAMLPAYLGRNLSNLLSGAERGHWFESVRERLIRGEGEKIQSLSAYLKKIEVLGAEMDQNPNHQALFRDLAAYGKGLADKYQIDIDVGEGLL